MNVQTLLARYQSENQTNIDAANRILTQARAEGRSNLTDREGEAVAQYQRQAQKARDNYDQAKAIVAEELRTDASMSDNTPTGARSPGQRDHTPSEWRYADSGRDAAVGRNQRFADHELVSEYAARNADRDRHIVGTHGDFGQMIRALSTSGASGVVPSEWSFPIIDKVRNNSVAFQAGATIVPMNAKVTNVGRLNSDPTAGFRAEGSPITASDPGFDMVTMTAVTLSALTVASMEFMADSPGADQTVSDAIAKSMALALDQVIFYGQLAAGNEPQAGNLASPNPKGILARLLSDAPTHVLGGATNGTTPATAKPYDEVVQTYYSVKRSNEVPSAFVSNDALVQSYAGMYDSTNQPLNAPDVVKSVPWLTTNMIGSFTAGTLTSKATDLFCGDFSQVLVGQRLDFSVQVLTERYAELGSVAIVSHWRGDVALARPNSMACYRYLAGA